MFPRRDTGVRRSRRGSKSVHEFGNNNRLGFTVEPQNKQPRKHSRALAPLSLSLCLHAVTTLLPPYRVNVTHQSHSELYTRRRFPVAVLGQTFLPETKASRHELNASIEETVFHVSREKHLPILDRFFNESSYFWKILIQNRNRNSFAMISIRSHLHASAQRGYRLSSLLARKRL